MDRQRFSAIAHGDHRLCSPVSEAKLAFVIDLLDVAPGGRVLDIGCGRGEALARVVDRWPVSGVGVDPSPFMIARAQQHAAGRRMEVFQLAAADYEDPRPFDLALCLGATHAFGTYGDTLTAIAQRLRPGGQALVGQGFWRRPPDPGYLAVLGASVDEMTDHRGNVLAARDRGLDLRYAAVSTADEWDEYEGLYLRAIERWVAAHPEDPERDEMLARIRGWHDAYLRWGRDTLGFGVYLFHRR